MHFLSYFAVFWCVPFVVANGTVEKSIQQSENQTERVCPAIHAETHGIKLICCSSKYPLEENCEYSTTMCTSNICKCHLEITLDLECTEESANKSFEWPNHSSNFSPLSCLSPNLPLDVQEYEVTVQKWTKHTSAFLSSLCSLPIRTLSLHDLNSLTPLLDLNACFPQLETLHFSLEKEEPIDIYPSFRLLSNLRNLRIVNVDFEFWQTMSPWVVSIHSLHIENSTVHQLPRWLIKNRHLNRIFIKGTELTSIDTISQLSSLQSVKLSHNQIIDLKKVVFISKQLYDVDLSYNQISSFSSHSFSNCGELRILDLSGNPIEELPSRAFQNNGKLKWLKMSGTKITTLLPEHFSGLSALKTLSLRNSPLSVVSSFAFLPLKSLKSIDLQGTNLTSLPMSLTHLCHLTHVNIADNLLSTEQSLPPSLIVHLSRLSQFRIDGNPLREFPSGLLLLSTDNTRLIKQIIHSLMILPLWTAEPCTPYYWNMHLVKSSASLRHLVSSWNYERMEREGMEYCRDQYQSIIDKQDIYKELERNSGCTVSRNLRRSALVHSSTPSVHSTPNFTHNRLDFSPPKDSHLDTVFPSTSSREDISRLLFFSISLNILFVFVFVVLVCMCCLGSTRKEYESH